MMMSSKKTVAKNIRNLRNSFGWSQTDLSENSGVSRTMIQYIEKGILSRGPTVGILDSIAESLGTTAWQIVRPKKERS
jgi:transcriptional regulator with XRE-family HTH domain